MAGDVVVAFKNVSFYRGTRRIFHNVDLTIPKGKVVALLGPSGCGKTTTLRLIGRQIVADKGLVRVFGQDVSHVSHKALYELRQRMGMLFQNGALFTNLNVYDNVAFPLREHTNFPESMIRDIVLMKLQAVGLRGARDLKVAELSGGMVRRVALARTIALDPELIMYDEPFAGQDPITKGILVRLIKELNTSLGSTSILVSHDIEETFSIADYVYILADGEVIAHGTPAEMRQAASSLAKQFIQGLPDGAIPYHYPANAYADDLQLGEKP